MPLEDLIVRLTWRCDDNGAFIYYRRALNNAIIRKRRVVSSASILAAPAPEQAELVALKMVASVTIIRLP